MALAGARAGMKSRRRGRGGGPHDAAGWAPRAATGRSPAARPPHAPEATGSPWLAAVALASVVVALLASYRINDYDVWQHLLVGKVIWQTHAVPTTHLWTWPNRGTPDLNSSWGFEALLYPFYAAGGVLGLFVWRWWTALAAFGLALLAARRLGGRGFAAAAVCVLAAVAARDRMEARPETLAAVLLAAFVWILERRRQGGPDATRWLPVLSLVWVNCHISYFWGPFLVGLHALAASRRSRRDPAARPAGLWGVLAACVAASFVNPFGWRAVWEPFQFVLAGRHELVYRTIRELQPVRLDDSWRELMPAALLLWPLLYVWRATRGRRDGLEAVLLVVFSAAGWSSRRFVGTYAVVMAPYAARAACEAMAALPPPGRAWTKGWRGAAATFALCVAMALPTLGISDPALGVGITPRAQFPGACDFIARHDVRGRMFNHFEAGGYFLWRFFPGRLPFTDIHQAGTREDMNAYVMALFREPWWHRLDAKFRFDHALVVRTSAADSLMTFLERDPAWALVFADDQAALYLRRGGAMDRVIADAGYHDLKLSPAGLAGLRARMVGDAVLGARLEAEVGRMARESRDNGEARSLLAELAAARAARTAP